ncbi:MAG TPA: dihydrolipoamide acetyltransferase family protein [Nitrospirota bacterium]|nr:dihydrolipoamide acetyltransferase family protein [Nitrospirota bacterium]
MAYDFKLPDLGEGIAEAEIRKWLVKAGDTIEEHQAVVEVETDKAVVEVPSPKKGTVLKINREEGETVKVGEVLLVVGEVGEKIEEPKAAEIKPKAEERPMSVSVVGVLPEEEEAVILATPAVRAFAKEQGVSLEKIRGTGPGGSITREDVQKASKLPPKAEDQFGTVERVAIRGVRKAIAKNLLFSLKTTASVTEADEADITELWSLRDREKKALQEKGIHLTFMPFFMKAVQHTCTEFGTFNASVDEQREEILIKKYFNIGVAVDTPEGLIVPVVKNVEKKTIRELAQELTDYSKQARERTVKLEDLKGSTFTITNYGTYGSTFATPIINYPDVAILGTGRITDKPWVREGKIVIRKVLPLSLTFDHRVNDGAGAAKFLSRLISYLEDPASLFIESA